MDRPEYVALVRRLLNKEGARRPIKSVGLIWQYETYGPLIGPKKEQHSGERD